jgi:DNA-binding LacI/PurR family transcriptional regulator
MALGVLRAARELALLVPDDLAVIGCDDIDPSQYAIPALTTVVQPKQDMARAGHGRPQMRSLTVSLQVRESCGGHIPRTTGN